MLMAHLSCAYLYTNKGIGSIPNEINEEANPHYGGKSAELNPRKTRMAINDSILLFWVLNPQAARICPLSMELNNTLLPMSYGSLSLGSQTSRDLRQGRN